MKNLFKETGFLSEDGKEFTKSFKQSLEDTLNNQDLKFASTDEVQALGINLMKMVADAISQKMQEARKIKSNPYNNMTDEEFEIHLNKKYHSPFCSLDPDEAERYEPIAKKGVDKIMKEIRKKNENPPQRFMKFMPVKYLSNK